MEHSPILLQREGPVARVTLNRAEARNALNLPMCLALRTTFETLDADAAVRVVLIDAAGPVFCAGADLKERKGKDETWVRSRRLAAFAAYEAALVGNDVPTLEALFHDDPRTIRYGGAENLYGMEAIRAFRRARSSEGLARDLRDTVITTYGADTGIAMTLFTRSSAPGRIGR